MSRISASGIANLFKGVHPNTRTVQPKKSSPIPVEGKLVELIFSHGHVQEHNAITEVGKRVQHMHGQNGFDRDLDHLDKTATMAASKVSVEGVVAYLKKTWTNGYKRLYAQKLGNEGRLALEEMAVVDNCIHSIETRLQVSFTQVATVVKEVASAAFGTPHTFSNGIIYDLPRFRHTIGGMTVICQPDGSCTYQDKLSIVEIKSCYGSLYTTKSSMSGAVIPKKISANANIAKWLHYLIQVAIEMIPSEFAGGLFVCFQGSKVDNMREKRLVLRPTRLKYIYFTRTSMEPLITAVTAFVASLSPTTSVDTSTSVAPYDIYQNLSPVRKEAALALYRATYEALIEVYRNIPRNTDGDVWNEWEVEEQGEQGEQKVEQIEDEPGILHVVGHYMYKLAPDYTFNTAITLEADSGNEHDKHAIKVMADGRQVAWIASREYIRKNTGGKFASVNLYANDALSVVLERVTSVEFVERRKSQVLLKVRYQLEIARSKR